MRVVSLVPSMTETLLAWGVEPAACTRFCEQPGIPHVGGTKDPDVAAIVRLKPHLVIVDAEENRLEDHDALVVAGLDVHALRIRSVDDANQQLAGLAARLGVAWHAWRPPPAALRVRAFVPIWRRPWMALGEPTYGSSLLAAIGVHNVFDEAGPYPTVTMEEAAERRPDVVIAPSEPYPFRERHRNELATVAPPVFVDGRDLLWWGARAPAAAQRLVDALATSGAGGSA
jgi:ABC-type Fe3+-hydroxamate transport system substrate-binding protein